jgi:NAD(P)-dependent dehydrogenase (short-subunit alcohol dehydrogenase family)
MAPSITVSAHFPCPRPLVTVTDVTPPRNRLARIAAGLAFPDIGPERLRAAVAGRTVLVTGASSGIGEATARRLAAAGATVLLVARREELLLQLQQRIASAGGRAVVHVADLADVDQIDALVARVQAENERLDVVVNNAGKSIRRSVELSYDRYHDYTRTMNVNYLGPVRLLLGLLPAMRHQGEGHLVNISTIGVDLPGPHWSAYVASKSAFETWLRCVSPEVRADGVTTSSIHFGLVHTAMSAPTERFDDLPGMSAGEAAGAVCRTIVTRRRRLRPWWSAMGALSAEFAPGLTERMLTLAYRNEAILVPTSTRRRRD